MRDFLPNRCVIAFVVPLLFWLILAIMAHTPNGYYKYGMFTAMLGGMLSYLVEPALAILAIMFGIFGIDKKENKKVRLLPFLGISLGVLGELLTLDLLYWHLVIKF